jgi:hypothetical protein
MSPNWEGFMGIHCGKPSDMRDVEEWMLLRSQVMTAWGALSSACQNVLSANGQAIRFDLQIRAYQVVTELQWTQSGDKHEVDEIWCDSRLGRRTRRHDETEIFSLYGHPTVPTEIRELTILDNRSSTRTRGVVNTLHWVLR